MHSRGLANEAAALRAALEALCHALIRAIHAGCQCLEGLFHHLEGALDVSYTLVDGKPITDWTEQLSRIKADWMPIF